MPCAGREGSTQGDLHFETNRTPNAELARALTLAHKIVIDIHKFPRSLCTQAINVLLGTHPSCGRCACGNDANLHAVCMEMQCHNRAVVGFEMYWLAALSQ